MIYSIKQDTLWYIDYQRSYYLLAERVYSRRTLEVKVRSVHENIHIMQSTSRISPFSEINTKHPSFSRETVLQKSELNTNYLLAGVGVVSFMVFFMIMIEIRRKSKSLYFPLKNMKIKRVMKPLYVKSKIHVYAH